MTTRQIIEELHNLKCALDVLQQAVINGPLPDDPPGWIKAMTERMAALEKTVNGIEMRLAILAQACVGLKEQMQQMQPK